MKIIRAFEPLFGSSATLFVECTEVELREYLLEHKLYAHAQALKDDPRTGKATTVTEKGEDGTVSTIVWLPHYRTELEEICNLAHECVHVASDICGEYGVDIQAGEANETFAYLTEHYLSEFMKRHGNFAYLNDQSRTT